MDRRWIEFTGKRHFEGNSAMSKTQRETRKKSHQNLRLAETQSQGSGMVGKGARESRCSGGRSGVSASYYANKRGPVKQPFELGET